MRSSLLFLALGLGAAHAQQLPATVLPAAAPARALGIATAPAPAAAPGVTTLSDVARRAPAESPAAPALVEVPPISPVEGGGKAPETSRVRVPTDDAESRAALSIVLSRLSMVGADTSAVLWIKGRNRKVVPGTRVLQYTVGEIRDDGVCLYKAKPDGSAKNKCQQFITFLQGV